MVAGQWFSARRRLRKSVWRPGWAPVGAFEAPPCAQSGLQGRFFALALASLAFAWPAACLPRGRLLGTRFWAQGFQTCVMAGCRQPGGGQRQGLQNMLAPWRLSGRGRFVCSTFVFFLLCARFDCCPPRAGGCAALCCCWPPLPMLRTIRKNSL